MARRASVERELADLTAEIDAMLEALPEGLEVAPALLEALEAVREKLTAQIDALDLALERGQTRRDELDTLGTSIDDLLAAFDDDDEPGDEPTGQAP